MRFFVSLVLVFVGFLSAEPPKKADCHSITWEWHAGRLGDKLVGVAQARFLSYSTNIRFLYRPHEYSEYMTIEHDALPFDQIAPTYQSFFHVKSADTLMQFFKMIRDPKTPPTLFFVDYFPNDTSEWDWPLTWWTAAIDVPWRDPKFSAYLKEAMKPKFEVPNFRVEGRLNVADHIRTLSGQDQKGDSDFSFPLKHPTLGYHERQIRKVYEWNMRKPMHVFIFSDTKTPLSLLKDMKSRFKDNEDITFNIQILDKPDTKYAIQDFYAMQKFDVLIATQSNFSMMASRLGNFDMVVFPVHAIGQYPNVEIDRVQLITRKNQWFPYEVNTVLRDDVGQPKPAAYARFL